MTKKEKILSGACYTYSDAGLDTKRTRAENLITDYDRLHPAETEARTAMIRELPGSVKWISHNSIIGAASVVTKSIPANVIPAGNPCRIIKSISENEL